jgi:hypothetical protein
MKKCRFTTLDKDLTIYPHTYLCPVICMGTVVVEPHGIATLLRCTLSAVVKSLSEKCVLHKYLLCSILAESVVQDIPAFPAPTRRLRAHITSGSPICGGYPYNCDASTTVLKSADGVAAWKTDGSVAFQWSSLDEACC